MNTSKLLKAIEVRPATSIILVTILTSAIILFTTNLDAQNRKPSFSQLDFDHTVKQKPKETPSPEPSNPLERILHEAKSTDKKVQAPQKEPKKTSPNKDQKTQ